MSRQILHLGDVGTGQLAKIANNSVLAVTLHAVHEALVLAREVGLGPQAMLEVLCSGAGDSWVARNWSAIGAATLAYPGGAEGVAALTHKDLALALAVAHAQGAALPLTALAAEDLLEPYRAAAGFVSVAAVTDSGGNPR
jgi:3-hydroxyisobutyrate dehydrogenase-like beta-hydroxyacid dehydrogenase